MTKTEVPSAPLVLRADEGPWERHSLWVGLSVAAVWIAVGAVSIFAPDLVTGSEQEHIPIAAFSTWFWGALATGLLLLAGAVSDGTTGRWRAVAIVVAVIWAVVAIAGIASPVLETGSDPTRVPLAVMFAPIAGALATAFICVDAAGCRRDR